MTETLKHSKLALDNNQRKLVKTNVRERCGPPKEGGGGGRGGRERERGGWGGGGRCPNMWPLLTKDPEILKQIKTRGTNIGQ